MEIKFVDDIKDGTLQMEAPHPFDALVFRWKLEKVQLSFFNFQPTNIALTSHKDDRSMVIQILMDMLGDTNLIINIFEYDREA